MKKLITNVTVGLAVGGAGADSPAQPRRPVPPPDTPHTQNIANEKLARIQPTKEGTEILKRLASQGEALIKTPSPAGGVHVNPANLKWLASVVKDLPGASLKEVDEKGYHHALVVRGADEKEDTWYIRSIGPSAGLFYGFGFWQMTFVHKDDPQTIMVHEGKKGITGKELSHALDEARHNALSQKNDPAGMKQYDLTKERPIGYLCFNGFDESDKITRKQYYEYSHALPELLKRCGYDMVCLDDGNRITELQALPAPNAVAGLVANPGLSGIAGYAAIPYESNARLVERQVAALHKRGVRDFYLNFLTHGDSKLGMLGYDDVWLKAEDLKKILLKYRDCRFAIDATGCEGGGLIGMMREFVDVPEAPEGRVVVFVHTKEHLTTLSHEYQALLVKMLADMADGVEGAPGTYGAAHYRTDLERRRTTTARHDPEFWKSMPGQPSQRTAQNDVTRPRTDVAAIVLHPASAQELVR